MSRLTRLELENERKGVMGTTTLILVAALTSAIVTVGRTVAIGLTMHKVPAKYRAEVLHELAECFRFWRK